MWISRLSLIMGLNFFLFGGGGDAQAPSSDTQTGGVRTGDQTLPEFTMFNSNWTLPDKVTLNQRADFVCEIRGAAQSVGSDVQLLLAQTSAKGDELITPNNTWSIVQMLQSCLDSECQMTQAIFAGTVSTTLSYTFIPNGRILKNLTGFFFCFGEGDSVVDFSCRSYSPPFNIDSAGKVKRQIGVRQFPSRPDPAPQTPTTVLTITSNLAYLNYEGGPQIPVPTQTPNPSSSLTTVTTNTATTTPTVANISSVMSSSSGSSKLATGAIVGITLGSLVGGVLIALAAICFCLRSRRRRRTRLATSGSGHEQVMLSRTIHGDNNLRDLLTEKDTAVHTLIHPNSNDSNFVLHDNSPNDSAVRQTLIPSGTTAYERGGHDAGEFRNSEHESTVFRDTDHDTSFRDSATLALQRHSALSAYEPTPSAPYPGQAASPPRRRPILAQAPAQVPAQVPAASAALSRNLSTSTSVSAQIPHSPISQYSDYPETEHATSPVHISRLANIGEEASSSSGRQSATRQIDGEPRYGDARHMPQVFPGTLQAPFLSEPGMSVEEMARLEEEERRIDAAILAADQARKRAGSGMR